MQARKHKPKEGNVQQIGGLTFSSGSLSLSLSLSPLFFKSHVLGFPSLYLALCCFPRVYQYLLYISYTLLGHTFWMQACMHYLYLYLAQTLFLGYDNICFIFLVPYQAIPLEHWQCLVYFLALQACILHDVCIYIIFLLQVVVHFV